MSDLVFFPLISTFHCAPIQQHVQRQCHRAAPESQRALLHPHAPPAERLCARTHPIVSWIAHGPEPARPPHYGHMHAATNTTFRPYPASHPATDPPSITVDDASYHSHSELTPTGPAPAATATRTPATSARPATDPVISAQPHTISSAATAAVSFGELHSS